MPLFIKGIFAGHWLLGWNFFFQHFKDVILLCFVLNNFWSEDCYNFYLCNFVGNVSFSSSCLQGFLFIFDFSSLNMMCLGVCLRMCVCVCTHPACISLYFLDLVLSLINYGKLSLIISSNISSAVFFLSFPSGILIICTLDCLILYQSF